MGFVLGSLEPKPCNRLCFSGSPQSAQVHTTGVFGCPSRSSASLGPGTKTLNPKPLNPPISEILGMLLWSIDADSRVEDSGFRV